MTTLSKSNGPRYLGTMWTHPGVIGRSSKLGKMDKLDRLNKQDVT